MTTAQRIALASAFERLQARVAAQQITETKMLLKFHPKYSKRIRRMIRKYRFAGVTILPDAITLMSWTPGRQRYTDKFVSRLFVIGAIHSEE